MAIQRGIGYWLVELDRLINQRFDEDLAAGGLGRRRWQVLHSLEEGPQHAGDVRDALDTFWSDDAEWPAELADLIENGLVSENGGVLSLTEAGRATHDEAWVRIGRRRRQMADGITGEQFAETVRMLQRMAANLADAPTAQVGSPA
ncbi:MarR family transcriptional regulator [Nocardia amamiensis]|uniref:MarR family transcriptional regulator n=1 Tax=Nocardia amamiensis TaxID=404578 RepID=A0ABS0CJA6_9NOCA|nr:MarR family transcriptional regulator [Nocardia amamiensis]MBF6296677.1 MarR family transcriptional regulator [Nocardia amamiensis]